MENEGLDANQPESTNDNTYGAVLGIPPGFVCRSSGISPHAWAAHCLDSWRMKRHHALAAFTISLSLYNTSETQHWPTPLNLYYRQKRSLSADVNISRWGLFGQSLLPRLRVSTNKHIIKQNKTKQKHMIRSLSLTLAAQQKYLGFLAKVISDSKNCFRLSVDWTKGLHHSSYLQLYLN